MMKMIYSIGDKFMLTGILCEVRHINRGKAWVALVEDSELGLKNVCFEVLNEKGKDRQGNKAYPVVNQECAAV